jgi:lipid-A-disaccharide synthase
MRYYIIAGERSGDLHGGNLVKALRKNDSSAEFRGFGGEYMQEAGVDITVHYGELAFMGLVELITNMNKIKRYIRQCREDIASYKPDVVILIDYGGFNLQIAKSSKKAGIKVFFYIPPKYWAWYPKRANWLKPHVDRLFVILPFEKDFFKRYNWESDYVGNPVLDAVKAHQGSEDFLKKNRLNTEKPIVALLPGSRKQELKTILPLMTDIVKRFKKDYQFGVAAVNNLDQQLYEEISGYENVRMIYEDTYNLLLHAKAAIVTSGTATLETALFKVPQVVVYKANPVSYFLAKWMITVEFISLVNLIAGKEVVKEMLQADASPGSVAQELKRILHDKQYRDEMIDNYENIIKVLDTGSASENAARLMTQYLRA